MNIIVKTPSALETEAFLLANIHRGTVRERVYEPFEYEPYEAEREIIAERLAEMGLKQGKYIKYEMIISNMIYKMRGDFHFPGIFVAFRL